jgi:predicted transcriptional regulator
MVVDYKLVVFAHGKRRKMILRCLEKGIKTPKMIADECKISISNVSVALPELKDKQLIECKNPENHTNKFYEITKKGINILKEENSIYSKESKQ